MRSSELEVQNLFKDIAESQDIDRQAKKSIRLKEAIMSQTENSENELHDIVLSQISQSQSDSAKLTQSVQKL